MGKSIKKVGIPFLIIIVSIIIMMIAIGMKKEPEKEIQPIKDFLVDVKLVNSETVSFFVESQGSVEPKHKTMLSTQVSGKIIDISENFVEGGFFKRGDVLVTLESSDYETDLLLAEAELARAQAALDEEIARGRVAEQEWRTVNSGEAPELGLRKPQRVREEANLKAAKAGLQRAKRNLQRTQVRAPYDGLVKIKNVDLGQFLPLGAQIGEIYSTEVAEVRLPLTDNDLAFLNDVSKQTAQVTLTADIAGERVRWNGELVRDEAVLDGRSRVIYGVVEVNDPYNQTQQIIGLKNEKLRFGRFVSAEIEGIAVQDIIILPRNVLRLDNTLLTVNSEMKINIKDVDVVKADDRFIYIRDGLVSGDKVIISSVPNAYEGMPVRFLESNTIPQESDTDSLVSEEVN